MPAQPMADDPSKRTGATPATLTFPDSPGQGTPPDPLGGDASADTVSPAPCPEERSKGKVGHRPSAWRPLAGQTFDDLELIEEIGRGGMGVVYKARQKSLDRVVAVKLLLAEHFAEPVRLARFQAEARAAACLSHSNIVQVYQIGESSLGHYFTMEYVEGQSLEALVKKNKITVASAAAITLTLANAVHYAHGKGIVHRDLKPANIVLDRSLRPVIMDFGIAKFLKQSSSLTQQGVLLGTPAYMAPEQAGETPYPVGPLTDVYSLGAILYNMLTGHAPFEEDTALRTVLKVIGPDRPEPVRRLNAAVPQRLERICLKCLRKPPHQRYASAQHLADALRRFHADQAQRPGAETLEKRAAGSTMQAAFPAFFLESLDSGQRIRVTHVHAVVGRTSDCDIIVRAADVSKQHCRLFLGPGEIVVEDLGSANGTYVNGEAVDRAVLQNGDRLGIASYEFLVRLEEPGS